MPRKYLHSIEHRDEKTIGFWDQDIRLSKLSQLGDPLEKLEKGVDFEMFRELLEERLTHEPQGKGGRPPYDIFLLTAFFLSISI